MLSLNSQPDKNGNSSAEISFGRKLGATFPSIVPPTQSLVTEKPTVTQNLIRRLPDIALGTRMPIRTDEQNLWDKKACL